MLIERSGNTIFRQIVARKSRNRSQKIHFPFENFNFIDIQRGIYATLIERSENLFMKVVLLRENRSQNQKIHPPFENLHLIVSFPDIASIQRRNV